MNTSANNLSGQDYDQSYFSSPLNAIRTALVKHISLLEGNKNLDYIDRFANNEPIITTRTKINLSNLEKICKIFKLPQDSFGGAVLLLCAGTELDESFAQLCAEAQGFGGKSHPTFSLALDVFKSPVWDENKQWNAITPTAPLRYWRLIDIVPGGGTLLSSRLRIDERILNFLMGEDHLDERLMGLIKLVNFSSRLLDSHKKQAEKVIKIWARHDVGNQQPPVVNLYGRDETTKRAISSYICEVMKRKLGLLSVQSLPTNPDELDALIRLWKREAALSEYVLLLECDEFDISDKSRASTIIRLVDGINSPEINISEEIKWRFIVSSPEKLDIRAKPAVALEIKTPSSKEQRDQWESYRDEFINCSDEYIQELTSQFDLYTGEIEVAYLQAKEDHDNNKDQKIAREKLWDSCRIQSRPLLDDLAQRIETAVKKKDLILPEAQHGILDDIVAHVKQRFTVYQKWGFASKSKRGLGISALFSGGSGTGKTLAAEYLANKLKLDLYRIDLSQVVSKYIGETEKNLKQVFDAAETGGAILLFDEADALFGKRSEVKDSHDRYANIEISYLLQRMEAYRGLVILTTNMKEAIDQSFLRRLRFVIDFPFPDSKQRAKIWKNMLSSEIPVFGLDFNKLARLSIAGGNIKNITSYAAFLAANSGEGVGMNLLLRAAYIEYAKLDRQLTAAELGNWKWISDEA